MATSAATATADQVEKANGSGRTPVVFIHGLWLLPSSWDRRATVFEQAGFAPVQPGSPADPATVPEPQAHPEELPRNTIGHAAAHFARLTPTPTNNPPPHRPPFP